MIFYLSLCIFIIFIISYSVNHDILFPSNILVLSFFISSLLSSILVIQIDVDITFKTFYLILIFLFSFVISSNLSYYIENSLLIRKYGVLLNKKTNFSISFINTNIYKLLILLSVQLFILIAFIFKLEGMLGQINSVTLSAYRKGTMFSSTGQGPSINYSMPSWINILVNVSELISFISIFILINNHFSKNKEYRNKSVNKLLHKKRLLLILSAIAYIPLTLLSSSRYNFVFIIVYTCFMYVFCARYSGHKMLKPIIYMIISLFILATTFGFIGSLIGRNGSTDNFVVYGGGGIVLFNDYIKHPIVNSYMNESINNIITNVSGFGPNTFNAVYKDLYKLHILSRYIPMNIQEFRDINGVSVGNVYTALRAYYTDFGTLGIIIFPLIMGTIFGYLYRKIKLIKIDGISIKLIVYACMNWTLVLSIYSETFFNTILSFGFYVNIFIIFVLLKIFY